MITRFRTFVFVAAFMAIVSPAAFAQNNTAGTAAHLTIGQTPVLLNLSVAPNTERWYDIQVRPGRSYCAEVTTSWLAEYTQDNPAVTVYAADGTTVIASNGDIGTEPDANFQSRACWMDAASAILRYIQVTQAGTTSHNYQLRITETTLWSSWYFVGGDYNSFLLMRNTTDADVSFVATWRNAAGTVVGTSGTLTVPAHGGAGINAKTYISDPVTNFNGTIDIAHNGSPDALVGQMTSLSSTTGLGFDAPLFQRKPW